MGVKVIERDIREASANEIIQFHLITTHYGIDHFMGVYLDKNSRPFVFSKEVLEDFPFPVQTEPVVLGYVQKGILGLGREPFIHQYNIGLDVQLWKPSKQQIEKHYDSTQKDPMLIFVNHIFASFVTFKSSLTGVWLYRNTLFKFKSKDEYSHDQTKLLVYDFYEKEQRKFARLKESFERDKSFKIVKRIRIPEKVKIEVWRRDQGKCVECGRKELLEYDHVIPVSKGGSNTTRNIQLLCEKCNRKKSNRIK